MREFLEASTRVRQGFREQYAHAREGQPVTVNAVGKQWAPWHLIMPKNCQRPSRSLAENSGRTVAHQPVGLKNNQGIQNATDRFLAADSGLKTGGEQAEGHRLITAENGISEFSEAIKGHGLGTDGTPLKGVSRPSARAREALEFCHALKGRAQEIQA